MNFITTIKSIAQKIKSVFRPTIIPNINKENIPNINTTRTQQKKKVIKKLENIEKTKHIKADQVNHYVKLVTNNLKKRKNNKCKKRSKRRVKRALNTSVHNLEFVDMDCVNSVKSKVMEDVEEMFYDANSGFYEPENVVDDNKVREDIKSVNKKKIEKDDNLLDEHKRRKKDQSINLNNKKSPTKIDKKRKNVDDCEINNKKVRMDTEKEEYLKKLREKHSIGVYGEKLDFLYIECDISIVSCPKKFSHMTMDEETIQQIKIKYKYEEHPKILKWSRVPEELINEYFSKENVEKIHAYKDKIKREEAEKYGKYNTMAYFNECQERVKKAKIQKDMVEIIYEDEKEQSKLDDYKIEFKMPAKDEVLKKAYMYPSIYENMKEENITESSSDDGENIQTEINRTENVEDSKVSVEKEQIEEGPLILQSEQAMNAFADKDEEIIDIQNKSNLDKKIKKEESFDAESKLDFMNNIQPIKNQELTDINIQNSKKDNSIGSEKAAFPSIGSDVNNKNLQDDTNFSKNNAYLPEFVTNHNKNSQPLSFMDDINTKCDIKDVNSANLFVDKNNEVLNDQEKYQFAFYSKLQTEDTNSNLYKIGQQNDTFDRFKTEPCENPQNINLLANSNIPDISTKDKKDQEQEQTFSFFNNTSKIENKDTNGFNNSVFSDTKQPLSFNINSTETINNETIPSNMNLKPCNNQDSFVNFNASGNNNINYSILGQDVSKFNNQPSNMIFDNSNSFKNQTSQDNNNSTCNYFNTQSYVTNNLVNLPHNNNNYEMNYNNNIVGDNMNVNKSYANNMNQTSQDFNNLQGRQNYVEKLDSNYPFSNNSESHMRYDNLNQQINVQKLQEKTESPYNNSFMNNTSSVNGNMINQNMNTGINGTFQTGMEVRNAHNIGNQFTGGTEEKNYNFNIFNPINGTQMDSNNQNTSSMFTNHSMNFNTFPNQPNPLYNTNNQTVGSIYNPNMNNVQNNPVNINVPQQNLFNNIQPQNNFNISDNIFMSGLLNSTNQQTKSVLTPAPSIFGSNLNENSGTGLSIFGNLNQDSLNNPEKPNINMFSFNQGNDENPEQNNKRRAHRRY